jgi:hypothetical protein
VYRSAILCIFLDCIQAKSSATDGWVGCGCSVVTGEYGSLVGEFPARMSWRFPRSANVVRLST